VNPAVDRLTLLITRLDTTVWMLGRDEPVTLEAIEALLEEAHAIAPALEPSQQPLLHARLNTLHAAVQAAHGRLKERIGSLGAGRRALHGYASLDHDDPAGRLLRRA
jgi:hypothetical protein